MTGHFEIESNLPAPFPEAIVRICETCLEGYRDVFGLGLAPGVSGTRVRVYAFLVPGGPSLAATSHCMPAEIHYSVPTEEALEPPGRGGPHHVFGFAHELGHLVMMFNHAEFSQGFASYLASEGVDYVARALGDHAWPRAYDYVSSEGTTRLDRWCRTRERGTEEAAAALLCQVSRKHSRRVIGEAINELRAQLCGRTFGGRTHSADMPQDVGEVGELLNALVKVTGDRHLHSLFDMRGFGE